MLKNANKSEKWDIMMFIALATKTISDQSFSIDKGKIEFFFTLVERQIKTSSIKFYWNHKEHYFGVYL